MKNVLSNLFAQLDDKTLCAIVSRVIEDSAESNDIIETIRMAWIPKCEIYSGRELVQYPKGEDDEALEKSEFTDTFFILESLGPLEKYRPPLQLDMLTAESCLQRYTAIKYEVMQSEASRVPHDLEVESWLLQSGYAQMLIESVASLIRSNIGDFNNLAAQIYHEIERSQLPVDTLAIDHLFASPESKERRRKKYFERLQQVDENDDEEDGGIAFGIWNSGKISPSLHSYTLGALQKHFETLGKHSRFEAVYRKLLQFKSQPAGVVLEANQGEIERFFSTLEVDWGMPESAQNGRVLWEEWCKAKLRGLNNEAAFKKTKGVHKSFYDALAKERFIDVFVGKVLKAE